MKILIIFIIFLSLFLVISQGIGHFDIDGLNELKLTMK